MAAPDLFAIWGRVIESSWAKLDSEEARAILKLKFKKPDLARIDKLSALARDGAISRRERDELETYLYIGRLLTLMHSSARRKLKSMKQAPVSRRKAS
jgi:hypothetical protein